MNILDSFMSLLFYFHTFGVRRPLKALDPDPDPDWFSKSKQHLTQNKKEGF